MQSSINATASALERLICQLPLIPELSSARSPLCSKTKSDYCPVPRHIILDPILRIDLGYPFAQSGLFELNLFVLVRKKG